MSFADAMLRVNAAVKAKLFSDTATVNSVAVSGKFDRPFSQEFGYIEGNKPTFTCVAADVSTVVHGTALTVNSTEYAVVGVQPDGTGMTVLILEKQ